MSSSRSIAAARNRRSGDTSQAPIHSRPNKSIASQSAFANGAQQSQNIKRPGQMQQQQQNYQHSEQINGQGGPIAKLSVSDAIGLVTLRLGRLETFMYDVQAGAIGTSHTLPDNTELVDKSVMTSVVQRIESLEKKETLSNSQSNSTISNLIQQVSKYEKEIKELKEILLNHILKYEKFLIENDKIHGYFNSAINELEQNLTINDSDFALQSHSLINGTTYNEMSNINELNEGNDTAISSINIKLAIEKELSNESL